MTHAKIDPRTKKYIKDEFEKCLYAPAYEKIQERIKEVVRVNGNLQRHNHPSFSYQGKFYNGTNYLPKYKNQYLDDSLKPTMDQIIHDQSVMDATEKPFTLAFINRALNLTHSMQDYILIFPTQLINYLNIHVNDPVLTIPRELSDEAVAEFLELNSAWLLMVKRRMVLNLIT